MAATVAEREHSSNVVTVAGGGGSGGLIVFLASTYMVPPLQDIAIYVAPTIGILAGGGLGLAQNSVRAWNADRTIKAELEKAKARLKEIETDLNSTSAHKESARKEVEALELLSLQVHRNRIGNSLHGPNGSESR